MLNMYKVSNSNRAGLIVSGVFPSFPMFYMKQFTMYRNIREPLGLGTSHPYFDSVRRVENG
jgi:hypothetical protein